MITVKLAQLASPLKSVRVPDACSLQDFLKKVGIGYSRSIRVNGNSVTQNQKLKANDIITAIGQVNGG